MAVPVVVGRPLRMFVVNADRIPVIGKFLDDPAVLGASGLDFVEVIRLADEPEVRGSEECAFLCREHQHPPFRGGQGVSFCFSISMCSFFLGSAMLNQIQGIIHSFQGHRLHKHPAFFLCNLQPSHAIKKRAWQAAQKSAACQAQCRLHHVSDGIVAVRPFFTE